jgi:hypothetical protein
MAATDLGGWRYGGRIGWMVERVMNKDIETALWCIDCKIFFFSINKDHEKTYTKQQLISAKKHILKLAALEYEREQRQSHEDPTPEKMRQDYEDAN